MKTTVELTQEEAAPLLRGEPYRLFLADGTEISLKIPPQDGTAARLPAEPARPPAVDPRPPQVTTRQGRTGKRRRRYGGSRGEKSAAKKKVFFRVLKETGDVVKAAKAAGVHQATGYIWRKAADGEGRTGTKAGKKQYPCGDCDESFETKQGLGGHRKIHKRKTRTDRIVRGKRRQLHPRQRDFNRANNLLFYCRPCNRSYPTKERLEAHQQEKHGMIMRSAPAAGAAA